MPDIEEQITGIYSPASSPQRHLRHQASLENVLDVASAAQDPLTSSERTAARQVFYRIVQHFEAIDPFQGMARAEQANAYSHPLLVRYTYEYSFSEDSRDVFLRAFFDSVGLDLAGLVNTRAEIDFDKVTPHFHGFADHLIDNFFLPLKASTAKTPQPSPAYHSAVLRAQGADTGTAHGFIGTPDRLASLRWECLQRDRHRCVVTRSFSNTEYQARFKAHRDNARDDGGALLSEQANARPFAALEVAHIIPHSIMKSASGQAALAVLDMFDKGVAHLVDGVEIDRARNALTLSIDIHRYFGAFEIYFEPVPGVHGAPETAQKNVYRIQSFLPPALNTMYGLPVTRTLFVTESRTIDPPSPRLLAVHRAIAHILHLSGAGDYLDKLLRDMDDSYVRADGGSALGRMVALGLRGWTSHGSAVHYE
ncbi:hypothetical protein SPBR_07308 [Sporothrix brasiliensis 5110]|uniref:HNH nuclease domain-containing protein n=1 Tax=Sporothrix brasiliensis 5110 TaxID=1398154 RepID=A0A0C2IK68_9PEZI|nr:uncharacterized protein SPBR_07308 [Sporothrix brasiliensis 5110]KIH89536.1 hypothetical protein SPBR_07308 [Sporothrix brasiliensis 5110]